MNKGGLHHVHVIQRTRNEDDADKFHEFSGKLISWCLDVRAGCFEPIARVYKVKFSKHKLEIKNIALIITASDFNTHQRSYLLKHKKLYYLHTKHIFSRFDFVGIKSHVEYQ